VVNPVPAVVAERPEPASSGHLFRRVARRPLAALALAWLLVVAVASLAASWLAPYGPLSMSLDHLLAGPSRRHLLGTDSLGRDVLTRLMFGGGQIFLDVLIVLVVVVILAIPLGVTIGLVRGWPDAAATRVADLILSTPGLMILLMVLAFFQHSMVAAMVALGFLSSPALLRVVRSAAISVSEEPYIAAARVSGLSQLQIAFRHVLPRITGSILVQLSLLAAGAVMADSALSYLGVGKQPPAPSWGGLVADASTAMFRQPWLLVPTGGVLMLTVLALVLLGDAIRDATTEPWSGASASAGRVRAKHNVKAKRDLVPGDGGEAMFAELRPQNAVVQIEQLTIAFPSSLNPTGWQPVVEGVTFGIGRGESVGLVGESGCGKTMTGLAILGLLPTGGRVTAGDIRIDGRPVSTMTGKQRKALRGSTIAFISQEPMAALDPLFTIGSQISEAVRAHTRCSRAAAKKRTLELLQLVQLEDPERVAGLRPFEVSGGMAQRVSIAVALAGNPAVLIADEPTTALDVTVQAEIIELLRSVQQETGMALLLISHDWGVVTKLCRRAIVMYTGQVVEYGDTGEILAKPFHPYSEGLLSANPKLAQPGAVLRTIPGTVPPPSQWPVSCHFQERCPYAEAVCSTEAIPLFEARPGRLTRCVRSHILTDIDDESESKESSETPLTVSTNGLKPDRGPTLLELDRLTVSYRRRGGREPFNAVDGVTLAIQPGETIGLVGESGSGKSTIGRAVLGLAPATSGRIHFEGRDITHLGFKERRPLTALIQAVFQDPYGSLNPALPIRRTLAEPLEVHERLSKTQVGLRVHEMMELVGLSPRAADRYPRDFSGGQRQRIAIARALMMSPRLVICDEPVSSLDLSIQAQILNLLVELQRSLELSYLFISHDLEVVRHVARRVFVIYRGQIMESGDTETVYRTPSHPYTRALLDSVPAPVANGTGEVVRVLKPANARLVPNAGEGCAYRSRCRFATEICATTRPELALSPTGALSACHHTDAVLADRPQVSSLTTRTTQKSDPGGADAGASDVTHYIGR
jgi:peptide/nickel transport system permease protein